MATFSAELRTALAQSRQTLDAWVETEIKYVDQHYEALVKDLQEQQESIDAERTKLLTLQLQSGLNIDKENDDENEKCSETSKYLDQQVKNQKLANENIEKQLNLTKAELEHLHSDYDTHKAAAMEAKSNEQNLEMSKKTTIDDLTRGIVNYKYLGLDFEKAEHERLRFSFTQLLDAAPEDTFSFELGTNLDNQWEILKCQPEVDYDEILARLNETSYMMEFIRSMRRAFLERLGT